MKDERTCLTLFPENRPPALFARSPVGYVEQASGYCFLERLAGTLREGKGKQFRIPDDLLTKWRREFHGLDLARKARPGS